MREGTSDNVAKKLEGRSALPLQFCKRVRALREADISGKAGLSQRGFHVDDAFIEVLGLGGD